MQLDAEVFDFLKIRLEENGAFRILMIITDLFKKKTFDNVIGQKMKHR